MGLVITPIETPRRFNPSLSRWQPRRNWADANWFGASMGATSPPMGGVAVAETGGAHGNRTAGRRLLHRLPQPQADRTSVVGPDHAARVRAGAGYEDLNDHDELRRDPMLAVALSKDDVKGEQRRRAQDRGKALAGKSTLNRLELTAPDYDGSPRQKESDKPETKKIVVDPDSIDALLVDLFLEAHQQAPD